MMNIDELIERLIIGHIQIGDCYYLKTSRNSDIFMSTREYDAYERVDLSIDDLYTIYVNDITILSRRYIRG